MFEYLEYGESLDDFLEGFSRSAATCRPGPEGIKGAAPRSSLMRILIDECAG